MNTFKIMKCKEVRMPYYGRSGDCGYDFFIPMSFKKTILKPGMSIKIALGIKCQIPLGYGLFMCDRSSVSTQMGLKVVAPVIDPSYTGEISGCFFNYTNEDIILEANMKIIQGVLIPYIKPIMEIVDSFDRETDRGENGFGSTNVN